MRQQIADRVDRRGEADADVRRALVGVDRGVHADHFAADVEQRAAGVARVDRRVGLQHVLLAARHAAERTAERADHADADAVAEPERVADRHDPVARLHLLGVAELHLGQRPARHLGQLDAAPCRSARRGRRPSPRTFRRGLVLEAHADGLGAFDHVVVGEDEARPCR